MWVKRSSHIEMFGGFLINGPVVFLQCRDNGALGHPDFVQQFQYFTLVLRVGAELGLRNSGFSVC